MPTQPSKQESPAEGINSSDPRLTALQGLMEVQGTIDIEQKELMFPFSGAWQPTIDPTLLGPENFQTLINMRYNDGGIEGINGFTYRNSTAITDYTNIKNGIQLRTPGRTIENYTLAYGVSSAGLGRIFSNTTRS